ncbi:hypothetical protein DENSPDRAFT_882227 [Dentipellis sp. KUC8613]|nr:hypothetical protein DENSPDRAFT_882227 [Dentipellis sp. KUC8613]
MAPCWILSIGPEASGAPAPEALIPRTRVRWPLGRAAHASAGRWAVPHARPLGRWAATLRAAGLRRSVSVGAYSYSYSYSLCLALLELGGCSDVHVTVWVTA